MRGAQIAAATAGAPGDQARCNSSSSSADGAAPSLRLNHNMLRAMVAAPFAVASLRMNDTKEGEKKEGEEGEEATGLAKVMQDTVGDAYKKGKDLYDRVYYGDVLPPVGSVRMSYARFLDLMHSKQVKRITVLGDGAVAIVEVPVEGWGSETEDIRHDRQDPQIMYAKQRPEWQMEKHRFYVELPGDFWESGVVMRALKMNIPHRTADGRIEHHQLLQEGQVTPELKVIDPSDQWVWLNQYAGQFVPIAGLLVLRSLLSTGTWLVEKFGKKKKDRMQEISEQYSKSPAKAFNLKSDDKKDGKTRKTGVSFDDVAGIDEVKADIEEVLTMMMGDQKYAGMGAKMPRGILLEGPPGTGKTYLAKAMAGEAGIPFFSANGAEFVEMFQGVAAARVRNLFKTARANAPAIVFIDEIDAIGKARGDGGGDSGSAEREHGLLQLLQEMDGFTRLDKVLVIGATNRVASLDDALLRPGRFDRSIYMGMPSRANRLRILEVHARGKPVSTAPSEKWPEGNALLNDIADLTTGYSGAELANILNECSILAVRMNKPEIDYEIALLAIEKYKLGLPQPVAPDSAPKRRAAAVQAGRAVLYALTPGMPPVEQVSMQPRGGSTARIMFRPQEYGRDGDQWHALSYGTRLANAEAPHGPIPAYDFLKGLLVPMYAARATEVALYGKEGATLASVPSISKAGELAHWLVRQSTLHPAFRDSALHYSMIMGGETDPTTAGMALAFEGLVVDLQREAYETALDLVRSRRDVIERVAEELCRRPNATVEGSFVIELLKSTPVVEGNGNSASDPAAGNGAGEHAGNGAVPSPLGGSGEASFRSGCGEARFQDAANLAQRAAQRLRDGLQVDTETVSSAVAVATGDAELASLPGAEAGPMAGAARSAAVPWPAEREAQMLDFATRLDAPFPQPPKVPDVSEDFLVHADLYQWAQRVRGGAPDWEHPPNEVEEIVIT